MGDMEHDILYEDDDDESAYTPEEAVIHTMFHEDHGRYAFTPFKDKFCKGLQKALREFSSAL